MASAHPSSQAAGRRSVLVVNDQEPVRQAVVRSLQAHGFRVRAATTSREVLESARLDRPDLILMDMDPPAIDGWEAARRIKADPVTKHILVVAMSEHAQTETRNQAMRVGCDAFAVKPFDVEHLVESVQALLPA